MSNIVIPLICALLAAGWFAVGATQEKRSPGIRKLTNFGGILAVLTGIAIVVIDVAKLPLAFYTVIPLFVATVVEFGCLIALASRLLSGRVSARAFLTGMLVIIGGTVLGVVLMFQPVSPAVFNLGFDFVLIAFILMNVWSHVTPRPNKAPTAER